MKEVEMLLKLCLWKKRSRTGGNRMETDERARNTSTVNAAAPLAGLRRKMLSLIEDF